MPPRGKAVTFRPMPSRATSRLGLTTSQAAQELGVSLGTVRRWTDLGHLSSYRTPGGQRRFSAAQIDEFVRSLSGAEGGSVDAPLDGGDADPAAHRLAS